MTFEYLQSLGPPCQNGFDYEQLIGVTGWGGCADLLEALDESGIQTEDFWVVQKAAEVGFEAGLRSNLITE